MVALGGGRDTMRSRRPGPGGCPCVPASSRVGPRRNAGFTLLEILVAVTLLALLIMLAMGSLRTAVRATRSGEALVERTDRTRVAQEFLRRQISHAMPLAFERMEDAGENRVFVADRDSLRFVAPMPGYLSRGGPHVQWLTFERDYDGMKLLFDHAQLNGYDPDNPKGKSRRQPVVLLSGFRDAEFEYRALDEDGELGDWERDWDDSQRLPLMVRLKIEYDRDAPDRWPDLEIPILTATAATGLFNPGRGQGRGRGRRNMVQPPVVPGGERQ